VFVGLVGFLMHLARAVDCRSVIVYGGREWPSISGYTCNENLVSRPPCSPCGLYDGCEYQRACMNEISVDEALAAIRRQVDRWGTPLPIDTALS
jgi:ADP-heptose:LPS heptosyltransferase